MSDPTSKSLGRKFFIMIKGDKSAKKPTTQLSQQEMNAKKAYRDSIAKKYGKKYSQTPGDE